MEMKILKQQQGKYNFSSKSKGVSLLELQKINKLVGRESGLNCQGIYVLTVEAKEEGIL